MGAKTSALAQSTQDSVQKILVVDSDPSIYDKLTKCLRPQGYQLYSALDGEEGLQKAQEIAPALMFVDIDLPKLDGLSLLGKLRATDSSEMARIPVIIVSQRAERPAIMAAMKHGADEYIVKPFTTRTITERVQRQLFQLDYLTLKITLSNLMHSDPALFSSLNLKDFDKASWDAYPAAHNNFQLVMLLPRAKHPTEMAQLEEKEATEQIKGFIKSTGRWKAIWPTG